MKKLSKNNKGFSLLELMLVIGIVVILAATTMVVFNPLEKQREQRDALRVSALTQIANSLELYYADNKQYPDTIADLVTYNSKIQELDPSNCSYFYEPVKDTETMTNNIGYIITSVKESTNFKIPSGQGLVTEEIDSNGQFNCDLTPTGFFQISTNASTY